MWTLNSRTKERSYWIPHDILTARSNSHRPYLERQNGILTIDFSACPYDLGIFESEPLRPATTLQVPFWLIHYKYAIIMVLRRVLLARGYWPLFIRGNSPGKTYQGEERYRMWRDLGGNIMIPLMASIYPRRNEAWGCSHVYFDSILFLRIVVAFIHDKELIYCDIQT